MRAAAIQPDASAPGRGGSLRQSVRVRAMAPRGADVLRQTGTRLGIEVEH